ncbi:MAG: sulfotransferase family protein [bacterium]|nr:sulfotransferase family protein [bacterium]
MILSHRYRFIFIKTMKTAGTSVEIALSRQCGEDDIITPITPADEATRSATGGRGPQNHLGPDGTAENPQFFNHMSGAEVRDLVGETIWNSYFKFCVERNPWERVVSLYYFRNREEPRPPIANFIEKPMVADLQRRGSGLYLIDDEVAVDRIVRYESLDEDLEEVRTHLRLPEPLVLPHAKSGFRPDRRGYRDLLSPSDIQRVAEIFGREIELLGYHS